MVKESKDTKARFANALFKLSETKSINKITVSDVLRETGAAKQTFYNHFKDINDLIFFASTAHFEKDYSRFYTEQGCLEILSYAKDHKAFFGQLPHHVGQNCFRKTHLTWLKSVYYAEVLHGTPCETSIQKHQLDAYLYGIVDLFMDWCESSMAWPPEAIAKVIFDSRPSFLQSDPLPDAHLKRVPDTTARDFQS